ncbi:MAG: DUF444 family protein [Planctomycetes bacterium]|nr:DUF444 family protein [Planctomycetota bacterium]
MQRIEHDHARFRDIVRGRIRKDLKKYVSQGELLGRVGRHSVSIPLPQLDLPHFHYGPNPKSGVGQGEGGEGDEVDEGAGQAGEEAGNHVLEVEVSFAELAKILGEELGLPRIQPKGRKELRTSGGTYTGISKVGPESLRHTRRTFKEALKKSILSGGYDPRKPLIIPSPEDRRYRAWKVKDLSVSSAVVLYMMDVSGSMGKEQKEIVRNQAFWMDAWLRSQYRSLEVVYIVHDAVAHVVDRDTFYHLRESGGTKISSAYELGLKVIDEKFPAAEWNVYAFHFSDGDNWSARDTERCVTLLRDEYQPRVNLFGYGQVKSAYGSGQFKKDLDGALTGQPWLVTSEINDREGIVASIKEFLGRGR